MDADNSTDLVVGFAQYRIVYFESPQEPFYVPERAGDQLVVRINRAHPFFRLYADLLRLPGATSAKEAVDLLLLTLARAELTAGSPQLAERYAAQRQRRWSPFLATAMTSLAQRLPRGEEDTADTAAAPVHATPTLDSTA